MKWKILIFGVLALAVFCIVPVSAAELLDRSTHEVITPWYEYTSNSRAIDPMYGSVSQGSSQSFDYYVPSGKNTLEVALVWSNSQNSLNLKVLRPNNAIYGPFYDNFEGIIDGKIPLVISGNPLMSGWWEFKITGDSVSGTQPFTLTANVP